MEKVKRAFSWQEFLASGFDGRDYSFPDFEGTVVGEIACKRWNRSQNLLVYLNLEDGRKIITEAWSTSHFLGLDELPVGTRIRITYQLSKKGNAFPNAVEPV